MAMRCPWLPLIREPFASWAMACLGTGCLARLVDTLQVCIQHLPGIEDQCLHRHGLPIEDSACIGMGCLATMAVALQRHGAGSLPAPCLFPQPYFLALLHPVACCSSTLITQEDQVSLQGLPGVQVPPA
jgi:hypothetical protein